MKNLVACALLVAAAAVACFAQLSTGSIVGTVLDASGAVVPSATIVIENQGTAAKVEVSSDGSGNFVAPVLTVGVYRLTVSKTGFRTQVRENIPLRVSDRVSIQVTLDPGAVQETVNVIAAAPLVETASTTLGGVAGTQQISELPLNGRSLSQLITVIPGVMILGGATQMSVNGVSLFRPEGGLRFLLDGGDASRVDADILENTFSFSRQRIGRASVDSIQEFRVYASSLPAEFGQTLAGVVNLITKSGTNQRHGSLFEYLRNEKLDTREYFNVPPARKPPFRLNQFGGSMGGPVVHDKLFFFGNYEGIRQRIGISQNVFVPTEAFRRSVVPAVRPVVDLLPLPNGEVSPTEPRLARFTRAVSNSLTENAAAIKIDYRISDKDNISGRYNIDESVTQQVFGVARGQTQTGPGRLQNAKLGWTRTFSPRVLNEGGFVFNRFRTDPRAADSEEILNFPLTGPSGGSAGVGPGLFDLLVAANSFTALDSLSWVNGRHQMKFGTQIIRNQYNRALNLQKIVTYVSLSDFAVNSPFAVSTLGQPRWGLRNTYYNFFAQDDVAVSRALTLNAGLRYQYDTAPSEANGRTHNFDPAAGQLTAKGSRPIDAPKNNWAPRLGVAWTPFPSQRTVVRASFGMFFTSMNVSLFQGLPNNVSQQSFSLNRLQVPDLVGFPFPTITSFAGVTTLAAAPRNWKTAYTEQWTFNIQQAFGQDTMLQVGFIGNRGIHLSGGRNLNRFIQGTARRPYPAWGDISFSRNDLISSYNSLQTSLRHRFSKGLTFNANWTWGHTLDQGGVSFGTASQDDTDPRNAYGSADFDVRHTLQFDYTYQLPTPRGLPGWLGGWQINGMTVMRSGFPVNVTCGCDSAGIGALTGRPDRVDGVPLRPANVDVPRAQWNINAFRNPPAGRFGNVGRNVLKGPGVYNWDFSLFKNFRVREGHRVQFRAEMFNIFNTPQFGTPGASLSAPATFGQSLSTVRALFALNTNRQIQFALRYSF